MVLQIHVTTSAPFDGGKAISNGALRHIMQTEGIFSAIVGMEHVRHVEMSLEAVKSALFHFD